MSPSLSSPSPAPTAPSRRPRPSPSRCATRASSGTAARSRTSTATLRADGDALALEGSARVDSISVVEPAAMRASVLGPDFFDAERHPEIAFRSTAVRLADDGRAEVDGELTIRGVTRPITASGHYASPRPAGFGEVAGLQLRTSFDRREFGFDWQMELPGGGDAVGWDVEVDIDLLLMREVTAPSA